MTLSAGTTVTVQVSGTTGSSLTTLSGYSTAGIASQVGNEISDLGQVQNLPVVTPNSLSDIANGFVFSFPYQATLTLLLYADIDSNDLISRISEAFSDATGSTPGSITIPSAGQATQATIDTGPSLSGLFGGLPAALTSLGTTTIVIVGIAAVILGYVLIQKEG